MGHELTATDLDLEDLDASQLEELVEPPELDTAPTSTPAASNAAAAPSQPAVTASSSTSAPVESGSQQYSHQPSYDAIAPYQQGQQDSNFGQQQDGQDRIKPSDMPDEGLVDILFPFSTLFLVAECALDKRRRRMFLSRRKSARRGLLNKGSLTLGSISVS